MADQPRSTIDDLIPPELVVELGSMDALGSRQVVDLFDVHRNELVRSLGETGPDLPAERPTEAVACEERPVTRVRRGATAIQAAPYAAGSLNATRLAGPGMDS